MTHGPLLRKISGHLDDLKVRNPRVYEQEERILGIQEARLGNEVAEAPIAVKSWERSK
jgi:hypothetical protein